MSVEVNEGRPYLERRVSEQAQKLYFSALYYHARHEIQYSDFQWADVLLLCALGRYLGHLFAFEVRESREFLVDDECHSESSKYHLKWWRPMVQLLCDPSFAKATEGTAYGSRFKSP